jgi:hypothetical protein
VASQAVLWDDVRLKLCNPDHSFFFIDITSIGLIVTIEYGSEYYYALREQGLTKGQILEYVETGVPPCRSTCLPPAPEPDQTCPEQPETPMRAGSREAAGTCQRFCVEYAVGMDLGCG